MSTPAWRLAAVALGAAGVFALGVWVGGERARAGIARLEGGLEGGRAGAGGGLAGGSPWARPSARGGQRAGDNAEAEVPAALRGAPEAMLRVMWGEPGGLAAAEATWGPGSLAMALDVLHLAGWAGQTEAGGLVALMERRTGQRLGDDRDAWYEYLWSQPEERHAGYAAFKSAAYGVLDPAFAGYFAEGASGGAGGGAARAAKIRLDEVRWGGVRQDGIPPLRGPAMIRAAEAGYLAAGDVVFGIEVNGEARAYPKRILAWHEMFVDRVGGVDVCGVYCTLCGTVILYETRVGGVSHEMGTSGFLYRSNKLMYDRATQSLWNTMWGTPVVGPLAEAEPAVVLPRRAVVTTTWGEWKRRHPGTTVLSLETGYERNYGEGVAYGDYFATDELMFTVPGAGRADGPIRSAGLANKREVLGLVFAEAGEKTLAIDTGFLQRTPVYAGRLGPVGFVVLTDASGANRVYETRVYQTGLDGRAEDVAIATYDGDVTARDADGAAWRVTEAGLEGAGGRVLRRLPGQRAFWFAWRSAFAEVELVK